VGYQLPEANVSRGHGHHRDVPCRASRFIDFETTLKSVKCTTDSGREIILLIWHTVIDGSRPSFQIMQIERRYLELFLKLSKSTWTLLYTRSGSADNDNWSD
jgi:hypothetical protein